MGPHVASTSLPFQFLLPWQTQSAGILAQEAATHASETNAGLPATPRDAIAPTPPSTGAAPDAAACWPPTLKASAAGAGRAGVPPNTNGAASAAAVAEKAEDGGPKMNGSVAGATAGAAARAGTVNVGGAVPKENAGMVVAADEALLACCETLPNAFTLLAAAGPPNGAVLAAALPSSVVAWLCAPNTPVKPARFERDGSHPARSALRHDTQR
jgi:hypothetical protein